MSLIQHILMVIATIAFLIATIAFLAWVFWKLAISHPKITWFEVVKKELGYSGLPAGCVYQIHKNANGQFKIKEWNEDRWQYTIGASLVANESKSIEECITGMNAMYAARKAREFKLIAVVDPEKIDYIGEGGNTWTQYRH